MEGEVRLIENKTNFHEDEFYEIITGMLNSLDVGQVAKYQIGFDNEGRIRGVSDFDKTLVSVNRAVSNLQKVTDRRAIRVSPNPGNLTIEVNEKNKTIIVKIVGDIHKPFFFDGAIVLRPGKEKHILRHRDDILSFIATNTQRELLIDPVLLSWKDIMCNVFLQDNIEPKRVDELLKLRKDGWWVRREELNQLRKLYAFVTSVTWFDTEEDLAAKNGLLKIMQATEATLTRIDRTTKTKIEQSYVPRIIIFLQYNGISQDNVTRDANSPFKFSAPAYYNGYDEKKSLIKLLEMLFPNKK